MRELEEYIIVQECSHSYILTPEQIVCRKVKASHKARGMSGKRLIFKAVYGYMCDPQDKEKWIIDPEATEKLSKRGNGKRLSRRRDE